MASPEAEPQARPPEQALPQTPDHWNDVYMLHDGNFPYKNDAELSLDERAQFDQIVAGQYDRVWGQEQALLDVISARIEGRESSTDLAERGLGKAAKSNFALVNEFYGRMSPANSMRGSETLMTAMSGLVLEEVVGGERAATEQSTESNIYFDSLGKVNAVTELLRREPARADGKTSELLLATELLQDALHAPSTLRERMGVTEHSEKQMIESIVTIADTTLQSLTAKELELRASTRPKDQKDRKGVMADMGRALTIKYDALFDSLAGEADPDAKAIQLVECMIEDFHALPDDIDSGYLYELFVPTLFRYAAATEGASDVARIWHSTTRADLPRDGLGNRVPRNMENPDATTVALSRHKKRAQDVVIGKVDEQSHRFGRVMSRWQLKAYDDKEAVQAVADEYDTDLVGIYSEDATQLYGALGALITEAGINLRDMGEDERRAVMEPAFKDLLSGLMKAVAADMRPEDSTNMGSPVRVGEHDVIVPSGQLLKDIVLPHYKRMISELVSK